MFDENPIYSLLTLGVISACCYFSHKQGKQEAYKEVEEKDKEMRLRNLEKMVREFNAGR